MKKNQQKHSEMFVPGAAATLSAGTDESAPRCRVGLETGHATVKRCLCLLTCLLLAWNAFASETNDVARIRGLVRDAERYGRRYYGHGMTAAIVVDYLKMWFDRPEFRALQEEMKKSWRVALAHLDEVAGDDIQKTILLCSGGYMGKKEFGQFLLAVADLADEGKVPPQVFLWCQYAIASPRKAFMSDNRNPVVREVKVRTSKLFAAETERREAAKARGESLDGLFPLPPDSLWEIPPGDDGIVPSAWRLPLAAGSGALVLAGCGIWLWRKRRKNGGPRGVRSGDEPT